MATELKLRRGTTSQHSSFTGAEAEVTVDTDKETVVVHDGTTVGGYALAREDMSNVPNDTISGDQIAGGDATFDSINVDSDTLFVDSANNRVGVGTSSPNQKLDISGGNGPRLRINDTDTNGDIQLRSFKGSGFLLADNDIAFFPGIGESMRIDSSGRVGIGTSSPNIQLALGDSDTGLQQQGDGELAIYTNNSERIRIDADGMFYRGTTTRAGRATFYGSTGGGPNSAIGIIDEQNQTANLGVTDAGNFYLSSNDGEVVAADQNNNITTISPHNFEMIPGGRSEEMAWAFYSRRGDTETDFQNTKYIAVDMTKAVRTIENLTGDKLIYTGSGEEADTNNVSSNTIQTLLDRIETLEAEVTSLKNA